MQEIAHTTKRIVSNRWTGTQPRFSRFKEELELGTQDVSHIVTTRSSAISLQGRSALGLDGNEDLLSLRGNIGYSAEQRENNANTSLLWERALREHAHDLSHRGNNPRRSSIYGPPKHIPRSRASKQVPKKAVSKSSLNTISQPTHEDDANISPKATPRVSPKATPKASQILDKVPDALLAPTPLPSRKLTLSKLIIPEFRFTAPDLNPAPKAHSPPSPVSWTKFPSHTRDARTGAAGSDDDVKVHDFGAAPPDTDVAAQPSTQLPALIQRRSTMSFSKRVLRRFATLRRNYSFEGDSGGRRSARKGFRSSISMGDEPEEPELELLGSLQPAYVAPESLSETLGGWKGSVKGKGREMDGTEEEETEMQSPPQSPPLGADNAKAWAREYQSCVRYPLSTDNSIGSVEHSSPPLQTSTLPPIQPPNTAFRLASSAWATSLECPGPSLAELRSQVSLRLPSGSSTAELRQSTVDFMERLEAQKRRQREKAMEVGERMWGEPARRGQSGMDGGHESADESEGEGEGEWMATGEGAGEVVERLLNPMLEVVSLVGEKDGAAEVIAAGGNVVQAGAAEVDAVEPNLAGGLMDWRQWGIELIVGLKASSIGVAVMAKDLSGFAY